jgi:hypothetical protein
LGTHVLLHSKEDEMKHTSDDVIDRLDDLADLAAVLEIGLIGLSQCNLQRARNGLGQIAHHMGDEIEKALETLCKAEKKLRVVGEEVRS